MVRWGMACALLGPSVAWAQVPTTVLWYHGNGGSNADLGAFSTHVQSALGGSVFQFNGNLQTLALTDYRYVVLGRPSQAFTADQITQIQEYLDQDGLLVLAGESNVGGDASIVAGNALLEALGLTMRLESYVYQNPIDETTSQVVCSVGTVPNSSPFLPTSNPLSVQNMGDIDPGSATVIAAYLTNDPNLGTINVQLAAVEGRVLLTADADFFSGNTCGASAKQALWNGLWTSVCDVDGDGVPAARCGGFDCDDTDPSSGATFLWVDGDGDGFGDPAKNAPCGGPDTVPDGSDCDDDDPDINPDAQEVCDGIDNDCDLLIDNDPIDPLEWYADFDDDGFGRIGDPTLACEQPENHVDVSGDCDDAVGSTYPGAPELCNGRDDNCNGLVDEGCPGGTGPIDPVDEGCGCATGGLGAAWWMLIAPLALRRRARR